MERRTADDPASSNAPAFPAHRTATPRTRPNHLGGDKTYNSHRNRRHPRRRQTKHTIPEPNNQQANRKRHASKSGRPTTLDSKTHKPHNKT